MSKFGDMTIGDCLKKLEGRETTPGPWRFDDAGPLSGNIVRFDVLAGPENNPFRVCEIDDTAAEVDSEKTSERRRAANRDLANARLIAASPDLLVACKAAKDVIGQHANCFNDPAFKADRIAFHALRKAIDKAEGK